MTQTLSPLTSIDFAREEFGATLADAERFVAAVGCTECGTEASQTRETAVIQRICQDCGATGCECVLTGDAHQGDVFWCSDCQPSCGCYYCTGD